MPANNTNQIVVCAEVSGQASYAFSRQDSIAFVREVPSGGTVLELPAGAFTGESYGFINSDLSAAAGSPITLSAASGTTVRGASSLVFPSAGCSATVVYDGAHSDWALCQSDGLGAAVQTLGPATPQGPAASVSFVSSAIVSATGRVKVTAMMSISASAANTEVQVALLRNGTEQVGPEPTVGAANDGDHAVCVTYVYVDDPTIGSSVSYTVTVTGSEGNVALAQNESIILLENV